MSDDLLDDVLETNEDDYKREDAEEQQAHEQATEAIEEQARQERDEGEPSVSDPGPEADEAEAEATAERDDGIQEPEREEEASADPGEEEDPRDKQNKGLRAEVARLRRELAQHKPTPAAAIDPTQLQQPVPGVPQAPPSAPTTQVPVQLSEDKQQVYVDASNPLFTEAIRQEAQRLIEEAQRPDPAQVAHEANARAIGSFVNENPEANTPVVQRAQQLDDYMSLNVQNLIAQGYQFESHEQVVQTMSDLGIMDQASQLFPDVADSVGLDTFVLGMASGQPAWRTQIYRQMATRSAPVPHRQDSGVPTPQRQQPGSGVLRGAPPSMARRGGTRSDSGMSDDKEFAALEKEFEANPIFFDDKKYNRLRSLGKKLDKAGWANSDR